LNVFKMLRDYPRAAHTFRFDLFAMFFTGAVGACIQVLEIVGAKAYGAGPFAIACIRSGMGLGMVASFLVATRIVNRSCVPFVIWPQLISRTLLVLIAAAPWLPKRFALPFFCFCAVAALSLEHVTHPARLTILRKSLPVHVRPMAASRSRQAQVLMILLLGGTLGILMDWNSPNPEGLGKWFSTIFSADLLDRGLIIKYGVPVLACFTFAGVFFFSRIREKRNGRNRNNTAKNIKREGISEWISVLTRNRSFLVFELGYFLFGFGNLMTLPLMVVLITKPQYGINASYFEAMLLQTVIWQAGILVAAPFMSRLVLRYNPLLLRGIFTLFFSLDLILLYIGYSTENITPLYWGKAIRGLIMAGGLLLWELGPLYFARSKEKAPTYIGIHTVLTGVRAVVSPWVGASLAAAFTLGSAVLVGACMQISAGLLLLIYFFFSREEKLRITGSEDAAEKKDQVQIT